MNPFRRSAVRAWTARIVLLAMLSPIASIPAMALQQGKPLPPTALVMTFAPAQQVEAAVPVNLGQNMTRAVTSSLRSVGGYDVYQYSSGSAPIVRAVEEGRLRQADVTPPFEDTTVVVRMAREMGVDYVLVGIIEDYSYNPSASQASVSVSAQWVEVKTGAILKSVAISAEASGTPEEVEGRLASEAANRLLRELALSVAQVAPTPTPSAEPKPRVRRANNLGWILLGIGLIAAIATGARSSGGGPEQPPAIPQ